MAVPDWDQGRTGEYARSSEGARSKMRGSNVMALEMC